LFGQNLSGLFPLPEQLYTVDFTYVIEPGLDELGSLLNGFSNLTYVFFIRTLKPFMMIIPRASERFMHEIFKN